MLGADIFVGMRRQCVVQMSGNLYFLFSAEHFSLSNIFPYILFQIIFVSKMLKYKINTQFTNADDDEDWFFEITPLKSSYYSKPVNKGKNSVCEVYLKQVTGEIIETFRTDGNYAVNSVPGYFWGTIFVV